MYSINQIADKHRVEIIFDGPHDYDYMRFSDDLKAAAIAVRSAEGVFDLLVDFSNAHVLPRENAEQSQRNIAWCLANGMRKSANIVPSTTHKMQVRRVSERSDNLAYFKDRGAAVAWLEE